MKNWTISLLELPEDSETASAFVTTQLKGAGLGVLRSFDLRSACASYPGQSCPHHGNSVCDCQLVILLVFDQQEKPVTVTLHTYDGCTQVGLAASPGQPSNPRLERRLRTILASQAISTGDYKHD